MEPVATEDVFQADPGASPVAIRNLGPEKVMKPRIFSLRRGFFMSARLITGAPTGVDAPFALHALGALLCRGIPVHAGLRTLGLRLWCAGESRGAECDDKA